jgi:hypothetical protein
MHEKLVIVLICLIIFLVVNTKKNMMNQTIGEKFSQIPNYGCTKCSDKDMFSCTQLPQSYTLKDGVTTIPANTPSVISAYRVDLYDPINPAYALEGTDYWWRQGGACPEPAPQSDLTPTTTTTPKLDPNSVKTTKSDPPSTSEEWLTPLIIGIVIVVIVVAIIIGSIVLAKKIKSNKAKEVANKVGGILKLSKLFTCTY